MFIRLSCNELAHLRVALPFAAASMTGATSLG
jgi:hypothetical protein